MSKEGDEWRTAICSRIFDEMKGMNLRQLARLEAEAHRIRETTNERGI